LGYAWILQIKLKSDECVEDVSENPWCLFCLPLAREAAIWELEEKQLEEKHQLAKRQLKDLFFLKRHQMITRHERVRLVKGKTAKG